MRRVERKRGTDRKRTAARRQGAIASVLLLCFATLAAGQPAEPADAPATPPQTTPTPAPAATPTPTPAEPEPLAVPEVIGRATEAERELRAIGTLPNEQSAITDIMAGLNAAVATTMKDATEDLGRIEQVVHARVLRDIRANWLRDQARFENWNRILTKRIRELEKALVRLDEIEALWRKAESDFRSQETPKAVFERISATLANAESARRTVTNRRDALVEVQAEIAIALDQISRVLVVVETAEQKLQRGLLERDAPSIVAAIRAGRMTDEVLKLEIAGLMRDLKAVREYARERSDQILLHLALGLVVILAMSYLRRVASKWPEDDEAVRAAAAVLSRPYACAILVVYALTPWLYPVAPSFFYHLSGLIVLVPLARLLQPLLHEAERRLVYAIVGFYALDVVRELISPLATLERMVFMVEMAAFAFVLSRMLRPGRITRLSARNRFWPLTSTALRLGIGLLIVAVGANAIGNVGLAAAIGQGVFTSTYTALALFGMYRVLEGVIVVALRSSVISRINMVRGYRALITRRALKSIRMLAVAVWFWRTIVAFEADSWFISATRAVLVWPIVIGDLNFTLGGVATFVAVFVIALVFSRMLRFTLDQDVLPRLRLPRGVPYAITATLHYGILFVALIAALTAAGIDLSKFSVLAGALGVGVGFGLQNVVNNFVSGMILLLERPIQTEDVVEVGTLLGTVRRIGIRSSTLRTFDGAEVIVPNANLISDQVVNWTLSDRQRRVEINVGVAYGNDPERVIELLEQAADDDARILERPSPEALFLGFGDSSLNFQMRAWTALYSDWLEVRSKLYISVYKRLREQGIEIPFPQRDIHVRDVAGAAAPISEATTEDPA